jgi:predicted glutamine amidotransferase
MSLSAVKQKETTIHPDIENHKSLHVVSQKDILMQSLIHFFNKKDHIDELLPVIEGTSKISLRILDWFVTNYSKKFNTSYVIENKKSGIPKSFTVYLAYKSQLKGYQKKQFDPFCRRERIRFIVHGGKEVITTVGQLNFFRWAIENKILRYINDHYNDIEKDMNESLKNMYKKKDESEKDKRRKRRQLSVSAIKTINKNNTSIVVSFN